MVYFVCQNKMCVPRRIDVERYDTTKCIRQHILLNDLKHFTTTIEIQPLLK